MCALHPPPVLVVPRAREEEEEEEEEQQTERRGNTTTDDRLADRVGPLVFATTTSWQCRHQHHHHLRGGGANVGCGREGGKYTLGPRAPQHGCPRWPDPAGTPLRAQSLQQMRLRPATTALAAGEFNVMC